MSSSTYMKPLEQLARGSGRNIDTIFNTFICITACTLAQQTREELYLETIKPYNKEELTHFQKAFASLIDEMNKHHFKDLLGGIHETLGSKKAKEMGGEFYTPEPVCKMMAQITVGDQLPTTRPITIHEPCTGSGRMILALAEAYINKGISTKNLWVEAWDVSISAVYMTFINSTLWSIPCNVVHGNTLSLKHYDTWPNMWFRPLPKQTPTQETPDTPTQTKTTETKGPKQTAPTLKREEATIKLGEGHEQTTLFDL